MSQNKILRYLLRNLAPIVIIFTMLIVALFFLLYENYTYSRQISEKNAIIQRLQIRDSISSQLLDIKETDTSFIYSYRSKSDGTILTYKELDSMVRAYDYELYVKDLILVKAKNKYQFNYSVKRIGDTIIMGFWSK